MVSGRYSAASNLRSVLRSNLRSVLQDAPGDGVELLHQFWITRFRGGDDRHLESIVRAVRAGLAFGGEIARHARHEPRGVLGIGAQDLDHGGDVDRIVAVM